MTTENFKREGLKKLGQNESFILLVQYVGLNPEKMKTMYALLQLLAYEFDTFEVSSVCSMQINVSNIDNACFVKQALNNLRDKI